MQEYTNETDKNEFLFCRQFILGPRFVQDLSGWNRVKLAEGFCLTSHPFLNVTRGKLENREIVCLGDIFDPTNPYSSQEKIISNLARDAANFMDFEKEVSTLAGRWVLLISIDHRTRLYPDAMGSKSVFYYKADHGALWVASQPQIIGETLNLQEDHDAVQKNHSNEYEGYPDKIVPYDGVVPLLPNHHLCLNTSKVTRFWPTDQLPRNDVDSATEIVASALSGIVESAINRYKVVAPLTGGYDTRTILAASKNSLNKVKFFTVNRPKYTPKFDLAKPARIAQILHLDYEVVKFEEPDCRFLSRLDRNVANMVSGAGRMIVKSVSHLASDSLVFTGVGTEITKSSSYKRGFHPRIVTAGLLCTLKGNPNNEESLSVFESWLDDIPKDKGIAVLDLFNWEQYIGNWAGMIFTASDTSYLAIPAFNCRFVLETMLSVDATYRAYPHTFYKKMVEISFPQLRSLDYNDNDYKLRLIRRFFHKFEFNRLFMLRCLGRVRQEWKWLIHKLVGR